MAELSELDQQREDEDVRTVYALVAQSVRRSVQAAGGGGAASASPAEDANAAQKTPEEDRSRFLHPNAPGRTGTHPFAPHPSEDMVQNGAFGCTGEHPDAFGCEMEHDAAPKAKRTPLPPRRLMAARLLLSGRRVHQVAADLGVSRHSVSRWMKDPRFTEAVRRLVIEASPPGADGGVDGDDEAGPDEA